MPLKSIVPREILFWICFSLALTFLLFPGLNSGRVPAFRDTFHFYYPLQVWLEEARQQGIYFPAWNPRDAYGASVASEATSALFYPLRCLWWLPGLTVAQRLSVFVFAHLTIAAMGVRYACERMRFSASSGCLAAVSYSLSCPVFFQHSNLVYLSSAAWIPWALAELGLLARSPKWEAESAFDPSNPIEPSEPQPKCWLFSIAATLMILSGDIQTAFHAMLLALLAVLFRLFALKSALEVFHGCVWVAGAGVLTAGLSAVQLLPAMHAAFNSDRWADASTLETQQQSLEQLPEVLREDMRAALANTGTTTSRYDFSIPPWHAATMLWPTVGGHFLPEHTRWFQLFQAEGRLWQPSLYVGILPLLLAIQLVISPKANFSRWLIVVAALSALAAMGHYGPVWMMRSLLNGLGYVEWSASLPADNAWSLYWVLSEFVPGYSAFRYPGKWTGWVACGVAFMAASRLDQLQSVGFARIPRISMLLFALLSSSLLAVSIAVERQTPVAREATRYWQALMDPTYADSWLGLPRPASALQMIQFAAALPLGIVLLLLILGLFRRIRAQFSGLIVALTLCEMVACCHHWIAFVQTPVSTDPPVAIRSQRGSLESTGLCWADNSHANFLSDCQRLGVDPNSPDRVKLLCDYQRRFLLGKLHLIGEFSSLSAVQSIEPRNVSRVKRCLASHDCLTPDDPRLDALLSWFGVSQRLVRLSVEAPNRNAVARNTASEAELGFQRVLAWKTVPSPAPFVELKGDNERSLNESQPASDSPVQILDSKPSKMSLRVNCPGPSSLIVRQYQDGCWRATVQPIDDDAQTSTEARIVPVERYAFVFQRIQIPTGDHLVTLVYSPWPRQLGASISALSLFLFITLGTAIAMPRPTELLR